MRNLPSIVSNYDSSSTGFSDGKLLELETEECRVICSTLSDRFVFMNE